MTWKLEISTAGPQRREHSSKLHKGTSHSGTTRAASTSGDSMEHQLRVSDALSSSAEVRSQYRYISRDFFPEDAIVGMDCPEDWGKWTDHDRNKHKEDFMRQTYGRDLFVFCDPDQLQFGTAGAGQLNIRKTYAWFEVQDVTGAGEKYDESIARISEAMDYAGEMTSLRPQLDEAMLPHGAFWDPGQEPDMAGYDLRSRDGARTKRMLDGVAETGAANARFGGESQDSLSSIDQQLLVHRQTTLVYQPDLTNETTTDDQVYLENRAVFDLDDDEPVFADRAIFDREKNPSLDIMAARNDAVRRTRSSNLVACNVLRPDASTSKRPQTSETSSQTTSKPSLASKYNAKIEDLISYVKAVDLQSIITNFQPQLREEYSRYSKVLVEITQSIGNAMCGWLRTQPGYRVGEKLDLKCYAEARALFKKQLMTMNQNWAEDHSMLSLQISLKSRIVEAQLSTIMAGFALTGRLHGSATEEERLQYISNVQRKVMEEQIAWTRRYARYWTQKTEGVKATPAGSQARSAGA